MNGDATAGDAAYTIEDGMVVYRTADRAVVVCSLDDEMAVAFDDEVLLKHGEADAVSKWAERVRTVLSGAGQNWLAEKIQVTRFQPTSLALAELNSCIACTGRIPVFHSHQVDVVEPMTLSQNFGL